ncbi:unnamed protein product, partial [Mesorhabditis belari]|uniref:cystathionine gamma-lyase n=1 Tax=Mesorhabditis belari TaxID=2138241 RepID=A0AAF3EP66_9BILA
MISKEHEPFIGFGTTAVHAGQESEKWDSNQVVAPISLSTTFKWEKPGEMPEHGYARTSNPTRASLQQCIAALEGAKHATAFSSGSAASVAVFELLKSGDHVLIDQGVFWGTTKILSHLESHGITFTTFDFTKQDEIKNELQKNTKLVWFETPSNPLLRVIDIKRVVEIVKNYNSHILLTVDNTFATPYFQKPIDFGVNIVVHSMSKYISGHSDVIMGAVITNCDQINNDLKRIQNVTGAVPSPFDCWLALRGAKTLHLRMEKHYENALNIAKFLEKQELVEKVIFPGLPSHPQYEIHQKQSSGSPGLITVFLKGNVDEASRFVHSLKLFTCAASLGGVESLVSHPWLMSFKDNMDGEKLGIRPNMIWFSVGIEDVRDLVVDLERALKMMQS